jgi:hypothetical protein
MNQRTHCLWRIRKNTLGKLMNIVFFVLSPAARAETYLIVEGGSTWQNRNDQSVPGSTGTRFSIAEFNQGPFAGYRLYLGHKWSNRHEMRLLYAPLALDLKGQFNKPVTFIDSTFAPNIDTNAFYKFNSYRLTYLYHFDENQGWNWALGFTAKVRDAEVRLTQGSVTESKKNVGFVPLLHFQVNGALGSFWFFRLDFDGLAAPQGRAIDLGLFLEKQIAGTQIFLFGGYRTVEGGADNKEVYNFAWFHTATIGFRAGI